jgi:alpha-mannosidase
MSNVHTLYFIHHSHTDIGYTHDQPVVFDLHGRFLDEALHLADKYSDRESDGAFRWTVETTYVLYRWLGQASARQIERFKTLERAGRIEVTGMFANLTPLLDTDQLVETFQLLRPLRDDFGFTIRHAMNCDVNGENWPLVDLLLDLGIEGLTMAINTHFGGAPMQRPNVFWWEGPTGRKILAYNGWPYDTGWRFGIGRDAAMFEETWWPRVERRLAEIDYPLPVLMVQSYHPFGDNGSAYEPFSDFIDAWNEQGKSPRIVMATPKDWWAAVKAHGDLLPTYRGDWTDYWNFGCISSAWEQALNRVSRARLRAADALAAAVVGRSDAAAESTASRSFARYRESAWHSLHLWDEHTWGADCSIRAPGAED